MRVSVGGNVPIQHYKKFGVVFILCGVLVLAALTYVGISFSVENIAFKKQAVSILGRIEWIDYSGDGMPEVMVRYIVDDWHYRVQSSYWSSSMVEGQSIEVWYCPETPSNAKVFTNPYATLITFILIGILGGALFVGMGALTYHIGDRVMKTGSVDLGALFRTSIIPSKKQS